MIVFTSAAIARSEVSALQHELGDDTVKSRTLVGQLLATSSCSFLSSAEGSEIF